MAEPRLDTLVASIESVMQQAMTLHAALLELLLRKRAALAAADTAAMVELSRLENEKVQQISELEKTRLELVARLTLRLVPGAAEPMPLRDLAVKLPEPMRSRLLVQRQKLREQMLKVKEQTSIARRATEALARHVQSLVQTVHSLASGAPAYSGAGAPPAAHRSALNTINLVA